MYEYYVVLVRLYQHEDYVNIFTPEEAIEHGWIDQNGNRIWIVPTEEEKSITFVWGCKTLDEAVDIYHVMTEQEIGIKTTAN